MNVEVNNGEIIIKLLVHFRKDGIFVVRLKKENNTVDDGLLQHYFYAYLNPKASSVRPKSLSWKLHA